MISAIGRSVIDGLGTAGYATRFFFRLLLEFFPLLRRPRLVTKQIHFVGNYSLVIIAVSGLFVGFVLAVPKAAPCGEGLDVRVDSVDVDRCAQAKAA